MQWKRRKSEWGEIRILARFAWLPMTMDDNTIVWLETYFEEQQYVQVGMDVWGNKIFEWRYAARTAKDLRR